MNEPYISPLSKLPAQTKPWPRHDIFSVDEDPKTELGEWSAFDSRTFRFPWPDSALYDESHCPLGSKDTGRLREKIVTLARSKLWINNRLRNRKSLFFLTRTCHDSILAQGKSWEKTFLSWIPVVTDDLLDEAEKLTLEAKAFGTLYCLRLAEKSMGDGVAVPYNLTEYPGKYLADKNKPERVISYACTPQEAAYVYQYLKEKGHIHIEPARTRDDIGDKIFLRLEGYQIADRIAAGQMTPSRTAFLVCRFNDEMDKIYREVYLSVGNHPKINCPIHRVKDINFNDRIDDHIVEEIRSSSVVLIDVTGDSFNVGFETGYAMALGKPLIFTMKKPHEREKQNLPFDIYTYNCLFWEEDKLDEFRDRLTARLSIALAQSSNLIPSISALPLI